MKILISYLLMFYVFMGILFADTRDWDFSNAEQYSCDNGKIEISSGKVTIRRTYVGPDWWNGNYLYRRKIAITNPNVSVLPDSYSVSYTETDSVVLSHMLINRNDLRVVYWDTNTNTWVGGIGGLDRHLITPEGANPTTVWFMLQKPITGNSSDTYYIYYGNTLAETSPQNLDKVYLFGDNFTGTTIDTFSKWVEVDNENYFTQNEKLIVSWGTNSWNRGMYSITNFNRTDTLSLEYDYKITGGRADPYRAFMHGWKDATTGISYTNLIYAYYNGGGSGSSPWSVYVYEDGSSRGLKTGTWVLNTDYRIRMILKAGGGCIYQQSTDSGVTWVTSYDSGYSSESPAKIGFCNHSQAFEIDNLRVRKYVFSEPTASAGLEEEFSYYLDNPAIQPQSAQKQLFSSITAFAETANNPAGSEIRYVLSSDKGSTWKYWNGSDWVASADTYSQANTAPAVNTNINSFTVGEANFLFKAFLHSDTGAVTPELDNVQITYQNILPKIETTYPTQSVRISVADVNNTFPIKIDFDQPMADTISWIDSGYLTIKDNDNNTVSFTLTYDTATCAVFLILNTPPLNYCKNYQVFISRFVRAVNTLPMGEDYLLNFTTMIESSWGATITYPTGEAMITINPGVLPKDAYVKINREKSSSISSAYYDARVTTSLRPLQDVAYPVEITDGNSSSLGTLNGNALLEFSYEDANNDGYIDGTLMEEICLSIFRLDESNNKWIKLDNCSLDKNNNKISASVDHLSSFMVMGYSNPERLLSGLINYPNPFSAGRESTKIVYTLTKDSNVTIMIYNLVGDLVRKMEFSAGSEGGKGLSSGYQNVITWDGRNNYGMLVANGMYICQITAQPSDGAGAGVEIVKIGVLK